MSEAVVLFLASQVCLILGFVLGRITAPARDILQDSVSDKKKSGAPVEKMRAVAIDEARFVTKVADDSLKGQNSPLGKSSTVEDDIGASVNKLAQLKRGR